ncbi:hypothetical protein CSC2_50210 [Clostridium zeae]|uniref:Yip1 domain-containing protein n=1 Tax=Clostridium zeae TaxID=2759022 RepID=A0ABQ1EI32_9CLOT|nr:hypothetical protein [Clostridium zeae]GFZ34495.1 hypothetical protein CSC2_50210 [Clostridium zeae]
MNLLNELKISLFKPHLYHTLKGESFGKLLRFDLIVSIAGLILYTIMKGFKSVIYGNFDVFLLYYKTLEIPTLIGIVLYATIGVAFAALFLSGIFFAYNKFKHINIPFTNVYNYANHTLLIAVFISNLLGPFVILFTVGFYMMAVRGDLLKARDGVSPLKYLKF